MRHPLVPALHDYSTQLLHELIAEPVIAEMIEDGQVTDDWNRDRQKVSWSTRDGQ